MNRPLAPPPYEVFAARRPGRGEAAITIDLQGLLFRLEGLDEDLAERLAARYALFVARVDSVRAGGAARRASPAEAASSASGSDAARDGAGAPPVLRVAVAAEPVDYFIDPPMAPEKNPVLIAYDGPRVRYLGHTLAGWFEVEGDRGEMLLARGTYETDLRAIENYLRAATAWRA